MGTIVRRLLVIGGDETGWENLRPFVSSGSCVAETRRIDHYPSPEELARVIRLFPPTVVFLGLESAPAASVVMAELELQIPATPVVAFNKLDDSRAVTEWMRAGVREIVKPPFTREQIEESLSRMAGLAVRRDPARVLPNLCAFLPARAGTGTSTLARHLSRTLAAEASTRVLLADFDLVSSTLRYVMNFNQGPTIRDAAESMDTMDAWRWQQIVVRLGELDVLNAGSLNPRRSLRTELVRRLLNYAASQYQVICADLSGNMEAYSLEVLSSAGAIFVVTQPDPLSLGAARDKVEFLQSLDLTKRAGLLVRQTPHTAVPATAQIEKFCGLPVSGVFDYSDVRPEHVTEEGGDKALPSPLKRQLARMAKAVTETVERPVFQLPVQSSGFSFSRR